MRSSDILKTLSFLTIILIGILLMSGCGEFGIQGPRQNVDDTPPDIEELKSNQDVKGLIKALGYKSEDYLIPNNAAFALVEIGEPAVEPLIEALKNENSQVRNIAVDSLIKIGDTRAIEPLIGVLNKYDDKNMAEDFLNCGNVQLEEAARHWAASKGYVIQPAGSGGPSWGSS